MARRKAGSVSRYGEVPSDGYFVIRSRTSREDQALEALEAARVWMATNAPGNAWANRVRVQLNRAIERLGGCLPDHVIQKESSKPAQSRG